MAKLSEILRGAAAALALLAAPALAQPAPPAAAAPSADRTQELADARLVQAAMADLGRGGVPAIQKHAKTLGEVLQRAPARYPLIDRDGDTTVIRTDGGGGPTPEQLAQALTRGGRNIRVEFNTYPMAALLLASFANEARRPDMALALTDRGLAIQPENAGLSSERAMSLFNLRRFAEGVAQADAWLAANPAGPTQDRARLLRSKGFGLIELGKLDEAEAAFQASLQLEPGHALALNELSYIAQLRAGAPKAGSEMITSDKAGKPPPKPKAGRDPT